MPRLIWSGAALRDVQRLWRFLAAKNPEAARKAVKAIRAGVWVIARHPEAGRPLETPEYREWPIALGDSGYMALYRYEGDLVTILAIRHQKETGS
jgi:plasmid stabilization system protein ParE